MIFQHCWSPENVDDHLSCFERSDDSCMLSGNKQNTISPSPLYACKDKERQFDIQCCVSNLDSHLKIKPCPQSISISMTIINFKLYLIYKS